MLLQLTSSKRSNSDVIIMAIINRWVNELLKIGYKSALRIEDLYNVTHEDSAKTVGDLLKRLLCEYTIN